MLEVPPIPLPGRASGAEAADFQPLQHYLKYAQLAAGRAPVMRLEESTRAELLEPRLAQLGAQWPEARCIVLDPPWAAGERVVILVSATEALAERAARVERALWRGPGHPDFPSALAAQGQLLGFPACCARALAVSGRSRTRDVEQLRVCARLREPAPAGQLGFLVPYVPCRPGCPRMGALVDELARRDAGGWIGRWARTYAVGDGAWRGWAGHSVLVSLDRPGELVVLRTSGRVDSESRLDVDPALVFSSDPRMHTLARPGALGLHDGVVEVWGPASSEPAARFEPGEVALLHPGRPGTSRRAGVADATYWRGVCD